MIILAHDREPCQQTQASSGSLQLSLVFSPWCSFGCFLETWEKNLGLCTDLGKSYLTATSLESWLALGNHPRMALIQVSEILQVCMIYPDVCWWPSSWQSSAGNEALIYRCYPMIVDIAINRGKSQPSFIFAEIRRAMTPTKPLNRIDIYLPHWVWVARVH